ncbi:MAG: hypothetical protein HY708_01980 [Ignavibacteriae bacterium]|nr:hypothetical protein [Ignavibacteriota bacterium]
MALHDVKSAILEIVNESVVKHSAQVIDLAVHGKQNKVLVEIFIDTEGGVHTDMCAEISRDVARMIENGNLIDRPFDLVVSSPGVDRPLTFPWQYKKHIGRRLRVKAGSDRGLQEIDGRLIGLSETGVTLELGKNNESVLIPFGAIEEAIVKVPW